MFNEVELVKKIVLGDMRAFTTLVKQYEKLVFTVVKRLVPNGSDVADVCQEVFIEVFKSLKKFKFESSLATWIGRIAYYTAITHIRKYYRQGPVDNVDTIDLAITREEVEQSITDKDQSAFIQLVISKMPPNYKAVLTLYHLENFSYQEIAEIMDVPEGTVKGNLFRARKLLKDLLAQHLK